MSKLYCLMLVWYCDGRLQRRIPYLIHIGFTVYAFSGLISVLFFHDVYAMEPSAEEIANMENIEYWQLQCQTYIEGRNAMTKPESTWTAEERKSVNDLLDLDEYTREKIAESLKDNHKVLHGAIGEQSKSKPESSQPSQVLGKRKNSSEDYGFKFTKTS